MDNKNPLALYSGWIHADPHYKFLKAAGYVTENPVKGFNMKKINGMIGVQA